MSLKVSIQMNTLADIDIRGDTTFALGLEAQRRGHELFIYEPQNLSMKIEENRKPEDSIFASGSCMRLIDNISHHFQAEPTETRSLINEDVILMRQDPPFDMQYITTTHLLEYIHPKTFVVNNPAEVRNAPEKLLVTSFPELMPPTLISRNTDDIRAFQQQYLDIIVKPLFGNGGAGVFHLAPGDQNLTALLELFLEHDTAPIMIQKYLPEIKKGDKRVILIDGEAVGAINRLPPTNEVRSNMHVGGKPVETTLNHIDYRIAEIIGPTLKERGLLFVGIDVIGNYLTEINVTSPTGLREIEHFSQKNLAINVWNAIESKL